jgi:hypothetical protein
MLGASSQLATAHSRMATIKGAGETLLEKVVIDGLGNTIVAGWGRNDIGINDATRTITRLYTAETTLGFVVKYSPTGVHLWSTQVSAVAAGTTQTRSVAVAVDTQNNVLVTGTQTAAAVNINVTGTTKAYFGQISGPGVFVIKYNPNGVGLWSARIATTSSQTKVDMDVTPKDNSIYVACNFATAVYDRNGGLIEGWASGSGRIVTVKYSFGGTVIWAADMDFGGGLLNLGGVGAATDGSGTISVIPGAILDASTLTVRDGAGTSSRSFSIPCTQILILILIVNVLQSKATACFRQLLSGIMRAAACVGRRDKTVTERRISTPWRWRHTEPCSLAERLGFQHRGHSLLRPLYRRTGIPCSIMKTTRQSA